MENAERDQNRVTTLIAVSSVDGVTPVKLYADPITHRLLVDVTGTGASPLTTKGDLYTFSTTNTRLPLGTAGQVLSVDTGEATGLKWITLGSGSGDVVGPASAVAGQMAVFDGTTGKLIKVFAPTAGSVLFAGASGVPTEDNSNFFYDNANDRLIIGGNTTDYTAITSSANVIKTGAAPVVAAGYGTSSGGYFLGLRANGTPGSATAVGSGNILTSVAGAGFDGTSWITATRGGLRVVSAEAWSSSAHGTSIIFSTTPTGTTSIVDMFYLNSNGTLGLGTTTSTGHINILATRSAAFPTTGGANFTMFDNTFTDTSSTGTVASMRGFVLGTPTFAASSATTYTAASTFYIAAAPTAGTNVTITTAYAIWSDNGINRLDGATWFGSTVLPFTNDGAALGTTANQFSDLFLASGAVINFNNGDVTLTHSADTLTLAGGILALPSSGFSINSTTVTTTAAQLNYLASATGTTGTTNTNLVFSTSPTITSANLITPTLGVATATSINGLTITTTTGALTIANGKTATFSNTITIAGTDSTVMTFPSSSATIARTDAGQVFTGVNTFTSPKILTDISDTNGNELIKFTSVASAINEITITNAATGTSPSISATGGGTDIDINLVPKGAGIVKGELKRFMVRLVASDTDQAVANSVGGDYRISNRAITIKAVGSYCDTAGTTGTYTIDINEAGTTILSTKITVDSTEKSSETAATAPVISDASIAADAVITFDVDAVQTTKAKGLVVWIDYVYA